MNKKQTLGFVGVLTSTVLATAIGSEREVLASWKQVVLSNDFQKTLTAVRSHKEEWPAVHSVKHRESKDEARRQVQTGYRDVAKSFLQGLEAHEKTLREMSPEAFCEGADALLDIRERFLKHPSYVNCFLVDNIHRVIFVNLGERLAREGDLPMCYDRIVKRLAEFRYDWDYLFELANVEYDTNQMSRAEIKDISLSDKADAIGKMVGQEQTFLMLPQDMHNLFGLRILEKRSSAAWLCRLAVTDHIIGAYLPALLAYRRKAVTFTPTDSVLQIESVLGRESYLSPTLQDGNPNVAGMATVALRKINSETWRQQLGFAASSVFTKEMIERLELQEAEREEQREATP